MRLQLTLLALLTPAALSIPAAQPEVLRGAFKPPPVIDSPQDPNPPLDGQIAAPTSVVPELPPAVTIYPSLTPKL